MQRIAVCGTDIKCRQKLTEVFSSLMLKETEAFEICYFENSEQMIESQNKNGYFRLAFTEFASACRDVGDFCGKFKMLMPETDLIIVANSTENISDECRLRSFDILVKPVSPTRLRSVCGRWLAEQCSLSGDFLNVNVQRSIVQISLCRTYYFKRSRRKITACMNGGDVQFYSDLEKLERSLKYNGFIRCHQSYLVNTKFISEIKGNKLIMADNTEIPVSRTYIKDVRNRVKDNR